MKPKTYKLTIKQILHSAIGECYAHIGSDHTNAVRVKLLVEILGTTNRDILSTEVDIPELDDLGRRILIPDVEESDIHV